MCIQEYVGEYEKMLTKLPLAYCLVYAYNYCYNKEDCNNCDKRFRQYGRLKCILDVSIPIKHKYCDSRGSCEDCCLETKEWDCSVITSVNKLIKRREV